jgi:hypothetical protein
VTSSGRSSTRSRISFAKGAVRGDRVGDVLQEDRLARPRRRDDQAALAEPDRGQDVDRAHRHVLLDVGVLEQDPLQRIIGDELLERGNLGNLVGIMPHHPVDPDDRRAALALAGGLDQHLDLVAALEPVAPNEALRQERVLRIEPVVHELVDYERAPVRQVDVAAVGEGALLLGRLDEDL